MTEPTRDQLAHDYTAALAVVDRLRRERDEARYHARILAHAYQDDHRPPDASVQIALAYPAMFPKTSEWRAAPVGDAQEPRP